LRLSESELAVVVAARKNSVRVRGARSVGVGNAVAVVEDAVVVVIRVTRVANTILIKVLLTRVEYIWTIVVSIIHPVIVRV
jgi:hypothetical protein